LRTRPIKVTQVGLYTLLLLPGKAPLSVISSQSAGQSMRQSLGYAVKIAFRFARFSQARSARYETSDG
jgi:hypothetical protein